MLPDCVKTRLHAQPPQYSAVARPYQDSFRSRHNTPVLAISIQQPPHCTVEPVGQGIWLNRAILVTSHKISSPTLGFGVAPVGESLVRINLQLCQSNHTH